MDEATFDQEMDATETGTVPGGPVEKAEGAARRAVLAGIGAVATACDTAEEQFDRFVHRGEQVQDEWQERADEVRRQNAGARTRFGDFVRSSMDTVLNGLNIPNKGDVETINVKLNILSRKLDDLQMEQIRESGPAPGSATPEAIVPQEDIGT